MTDTEKAYTQGQRDARDGVPFIPRSTQERYVGPIADSIWSAYCAGRGVQ